MIDTILPTNSSKLIDSRFRGSKLSDASEAVILSEKYLSLMNTRNLLALIALALTSSAFAQNLPPAEFSIERLSSYPLIQGRSPAAPSMAPNGSKIVFGWNHTGERKLDLYVLDFPNGSPKKIVEAASIKDLPRQDDTRSEQDKKEAALYDGGIAGAQWSPDAKELMFNYKGRVWLVKPDGSDLRTLFDGSAGFAGIKYTDDGKSFSYSNGTNVFIRDRKTGDTKQLTFISKPGTSIDDYEFSSNGKWLAVQWSDSAKVGSHNMMDFSKDRATVVPIQRTWNGELSEDHQIGILPASGGIIKFIPDIPRYCWIKNASWSPDGNHFEVGWMKDNFMEYTISVVDPEKATKKDVYTEKAPRNTINDWRDAVWSRDSKRIIFGTDIKGDTLINRSVFSMNVDGTDVKPVFSKFYDVGVQARACSMLAKCPG